MAYTLHQISTIPIFIVAAGFTLICPIVVESQQWHFYGLTITRVPSNMDNAITKLSFWKTGIERLEYDSFPGLVHVSLMYLYDNLLHFIDDEAFKLCLSLIEILLRSNMLLALPASYGPNSASIFVELGLSYNRELSIPVNHFVNFTALKVVQFAATNQMALPEFARNSSIMQINGVWTPIQTVPDLRHLPRLSYLSLSRDDIVCDWRLCWILFEELNITSRPTYYSSSRNDLDGLVCQNPTASQSIALQDHSPLQLECYKSKSLNN